MATFHLQDPEQRRHTPGSLPWRLLHADAVGNVLHWSTYREYVVYQKVFVLNAVRFGLEAALVGTAARMGLLSPRVFLVGLNFQTGSVCPAHPSLAAAS